MDKELYPVSEIKFGENILSDGSIIIKPTIGPNTTYTKEEYEQYKLHESKLTAIYSAKLKKAEENPNGRLARILLRAYNKSIEDIVLKNNNTPELNEVRITREAYDKANLISRRVCDLLGNNEIYMHLLNFKDKKEAGNNIIRDVYIIKDQIVDPVSCDENSAKGVIETLQDIKEQKKTIIGWGHSHARNLGVFYSGKDIDNITNLTYGANKLDITPKPFSCSNTKFRVRYFPCLVFDADNVKPATAIGILYPKLTLNGIERKFIIKENPELKIIDEENKIETRQSIIDAEILERVIPAYPIYQGKKKASEIIIDNNGKEVKEESPQKPKTESPEIIDLMQIKRAQDINDLEEERRENAGGIKEFYKKRIRRLRDYIYAPEELIKTRRELEEIKKDYTELRTYYVTLEGRVKSLEDKLR